MGSNGLAVCAAMLLAASCLPVEDAAAGSVAVCITNCSQCKQMFGIYFHGQACAESCLESRGFFYPDCNNPSSVRGFLKRLH